MALVLNRGNQNQWVDLTDILVDVPRQSLITDSLGIFEDNFSPVKTVEIRRTQGVSHLVVDRNWDERNSNIVGGAKQSLQLAIPHFPLDDAITPNDIDATVQVNSIQEAMGLETVANVRLDKMTNLRAAHDLTKEAARMELIVDGTAYAPNGTLRTSYGKTVNFYTEFGITRTETEITTFAGVGDPRSQIEGIRKAVVSGTRGAIGVPRVVALCGSAYFDALASNAFVNDAVKYQQMPGLSRELLVGRPDNNPFGLNGLYRTLDLWGVTFVDAGEAGYTNLAGTFVPFIGAKEARFLPVGLRGAFKTYYAPCQKFSTINRAAQGSYWFEYANEKDSKIEIESEQNFLNALLFPASVVRSYIA